MAREGWHRAACRCHAPVHAMCAAASGAPLVKRLGLSWPVQPACVQPWESQAVHVGAPAVVKSLQAAVTNTNKGQAQVYMRRCVPARAKEGMGRLGSIFQRIQLAHHQQCTSR